MFTTFSGRSTGCIRLLALAAIAGFASSAEANLVYNGSFNTPKNDRPEGWSAYKVPGTDVHPPHWVQWHVPNGSWDGSACIEVGHSHRNFATIAYGDSGQYARFKLDGERAINVNPYGYYKLTVDYATNNIDWWQGSQSIVQVDFWSGSPKSGGSFVESNHYNLVPTAGAWRTFTVYFRPIRSSDRGFGSKDTNYLQLKLGVSSSAGTTRFDNLTVTEVSHAEYQANLPYKTFQPDQLPGRRGKSPSFSPSNTFSVRQHNGVWWLVRPNGSSFWWKTVQGIGVHASENPELFNSLPGAYKSGTSSNHQYYIDSKKRLGDLGFNADSIINGQAQPRIHNLGLTNAGYPSSVLLQDANGKTNSGQKAMPDPYNPTWLNYIRDYIRNSLATYAQMDQPDFAGYFTDNEMHVEELDKYIWSPYAAQQFVWLMQSRYGSIANLNARWTNASIGRHFNMSSFNDILAHGNKSRIRRWMPNDPLGDDVELFVKEMLKSYYAHICNVIREYEVERFGDWDKDGVANKRFMICTNRFDLAGFPNEFVPDLAIAMDAIRELNASRNWYYFDILCVNNYPGDEHREGVKDYDNFWLLEGMSQRAGLPVMISEFGVHARDAGFPTGNNTTGSKGWFKRSVDSDADRGMVYDKMIRQWASSPYIIGAQWFKWSNVMQDMGGPTSLPVNSGSASYNARNSGVVNNGNGFYPALAKQMQATNDYLTAAFRNVTSFQRYAQRFIVRAPGFTGYQELIFNYTTGLMEVTPYLNVDASLWQDTPANQWLGVYHYDYAQGRYTMAKYKLKDRL